jgi:hypothetical protein
MTINPEEHAASYKAVVDIARYGFEVEYINSKGEGYKLDFIPFGSFEAMVHAYQDFKKHGKDDTESKA